MLTERMLDFSNSSLNEIVQGERELVLVFPGQPCFSDAQGDNPMRVPVFASRLRVADGKVDLCQVSFPFEPDYWHIKYGGGYERAYFIPIPFEADGPVELSFYLPDETLALVVRGPRVVLSLDEQIRIDEYWPQPNKSLERTREG